MNLTFRGDWSGSTAYSPYDAVNFSSDRYVALIPVSGSLPPTDISRNTWWSGLYTTGTNQYFFVDGNGQNVEISGTLSVPVTSALSVTNVVVGAQTVPYAGTIAFDFDGSGFQSVSLGGPLYVQTQNRGIGKVVRVFLDGDTVDRAVGLATGIKTVGPFNAIATANKVALMTLYSRGTNESNTVVAAMF
jgi:hypothetical protein